MKKQILQKTKKEEAVKRVPVDFNYEALHPQFLHGLARIAAYAAEKYGSWEQYTKARLTGEKSPINHIYGHLRQYRLGEPYEKFDGDTRWHLVAIAYNAAMQFYYDSKFPKDDAARVFQEGR